MEKYKITLTQFCNYISKTGMHRYNAAKAIMRELQTEYNYPTDYWGQLRSRISYVLSHSGKAEDLDSIVDEVPVDRRDNYREKVEGIKKFWKKRTLTKLSVPKKVWKYKNLRINVSPEMCFAYGDKTFVIKLFFSSKDKKITKNEADVLLEVIRVTLGLNPREVTIGILDVSKGKLFTYSNNSDALCRFIRTEAESLYTNLIDISNW